MEIIEIIKDIENWKNIGELSKKRFACAHCGSTWIELVGSIVGQEEGSEDLYLRIGMESENCQMCRFRLLECQECGSKDVYEIRFADEIPEGVSFSFRDIKKVSRSSNTERR